jgi:hypothetical protein
MRRDEEHWQHARVRGAWFVRSLVRQITEADGVSR